MKLSEPRFDAYHATVPTVADLLSEGIADALGADRIEWQRPIGGYHRGVGIHSGDELLCSVMDGGYNPLPFVYAQGVRTPDVVAHLRERYPDHAVARADSCVDIDAGPGTWQQLHSLLSPFALDRNLTWRYIESGADAKSSEGAQAASFYIGSPKSVAQTRTYAKGLEMIQKGVSLDGTGYTPHTCRHEVQARPQSRHKSRLATASPVEVFGTSKWSQTLVESLLGLSTGRLVIGRVHHPDDFQRRLANVLRIAGPTLRQLRADQSCAEEFGVVLDQLLSLDRLLS